MSAAEPARSAPAGPAPAPAAVGGRPSRRRVVRDPARGVLGGVCAGVGASLGVPVLALRLGTLALVAFGGLGAAAYALGWVALPARDRGVPRRSRRAGLEVSAGAVLLVLAALLSLRELGWWLSDAIVWPLLLATAGGSLLWRPTPREREAGTAAGGPAASAPAGEREGGRRRSPGAEARRRAAVYRGGFGVALVLGAALLLLGSLGVLGPLRDVVLGVVVVATALGLILAPFLWRLGRNLAGERAARIRSQERAEVAAHLHDSVLQTLALVQKRADDPRAVAALARRQERELRAWLWASRAPSAAESVAGALAAVAAEVEDDHGVVVEVVTVGDAEVDGRAAALVAAAREALTNAAKFAGADGPIDLFLEAEPERLSVFVRDRGPGFDPATVPADRRGVRDSIQARMARHGGRAAVGAAPGGGTEVELSVDRRPA